MKSLQTRTTTTTQSDDKSSHDPLGQVS